MQQMTDKFQLAFQRDDKSTMQKRIRMKDERSLQAVDNHGAGLPGRMIGFRGWRNCKPNDGPKDDYRNRPRRDRRLRARTIVFPIISPRSRFHLDRILAHDASGESIILTNGPKHVLSGHSAPRTGQFNKQGRA